MTAQDEARELLEAIRDFGRGDERGPKLATVDPALAGAATAARVTFDGEASLSSRAYPWLGTKPPASARVLLLPVGRGYVILGALSA